MIDYNYLGILNKDIFIHEKIEFYQICKNLIENQIILVLFFILPTNVNINVNVHLFAKNLIKN